MERSILAGTAALLMVAASPAGSQEPSPRGFRVRCAEADGSPVGGATVHVFQRIGVPGEAGVYGKFGPFETDDRGFAHCPVALTHGGGRFDRFVHARVPDRLVGGARSVRFDDPDEGDGPPVVDVRMVPSRVLSGTVSVPAGFEPSRVRVSVLSIYDVSGGGFGTPLGRVHGMTGLDEALPEVFECAVGGDGGFVLRDLPVQARVYLSASCPGLAEQQYSNLQAELPEQIELGMFEESRLEGQVRGPDGTAIAGARVTARLSASGSAVVLDEFPGRTDAAGRFRIGGLPAGSVDVRVVVERSELVFMPRSVELGEPGSETSVELELEEGVPLAGSVVAEGDRAPIPCARVAAITAEDDRLAIASARTDDSGRFRLVLPRVPVRLYFSSIPRGFVYPDPQVVAELEAGAPRALPLRLTLARDE